jgi:uncharacterized RDD family membrane protein YckC
MPPAADTSAPTEVDVAKPSMPRPDSGRFFGWSIDHFTIGRQLGTGGMGAVYLARDTALERTVALKVLRDEMAARVEARERFVREARAQARLNSPNVVHVYFVGYVPPRRPDEDEEPARRRAADGPGALYFAMEYVDGESLEALVDRGEKLAPERARKLMIDAARGLADAHRAGVVHRDVNPGNLLVTKSGAVKVADFGLAKPSDPKLALTRGGVILGTPHYMAPEQGSGATLDFRADMYSLGCTFYHLLAGKPPFEGPNSVSLIMQHLHKPAPPLATVAPGTPPALVAIIDRLMMKKPDERFASYDELVAALIAAAPKDIEYAGFWTRAAAFTVDAATASLLVAGLGWPGLVLYLVYTWAAHAFTGQTLGKYALRIQVCGLDQKKIGPWRALARTAVTWWFPLLLALFIISTQGVGELEQSVGALTGLEQAKRLVVPLVVSNVLLSLLYAAGFLMAALRRDRRAVHDLAADSCVRYLLAR